MLQQSQPEDFVIATGKTTSVRDFCRMAFREVGIKVEFTGEGAQEKGIVVDSEHPHVSVGQEILAIDPRYFRPAEVELLIGDASKANAKLGWKPKFTLEELVHDMVQSDIKAFQREEYLKNGGYEILNQFE
jgi:GDPmannose 4,6-dehydratase